jgi:peptidoglycan/xylan/chitin deacetylase (PgdA/CDA1 family)
VKLTPRLTAQLAREWLARKWRRRTVPHGVILMYHRVARPSADPWKICVSPANFAGHMQELREMAEVAPVQDVLQSLRSGRRAKPVAAVTFDDAYLDNLTDAKPVLERYGVPATVFVPTGWVGSTRPIWWDHLTHAVLEAPKLPRMLNLDVAGLRIAWRDLDLDAGTRGGRRARQRLYREIWSQLRVLNDVDREAALDRLLEVLGTDDTTMRDVRVMSADELRALTDGGVVQIGSHSVTHPSLPNLPSEAKAWQIEQSAKQFCELTGQRPSLFAYPYGDLDQESVDLVRASGYTTACSIREDLVWEDADPFTLPRLAVGDWTPAEFRIRMRHYWFA